jgi:hypothetical protein
VPGGGTYQIVTDLKLPDGKTFTLKSLAAANEESVTANVDTNSTLIAETFLEGGELGDFNNAEFRDGLAKAKARLAKADLPENWTDKESVKAAARKHGERIRDAFAGLRARIQAAAATATVKVEEWKAKARDRFRTRIAPQAPNTSSSASPTAPQAGQLKKHTFYFLENTPAAWFPMEVELVSTKPVHTSTLTFTKAGERLEVEVYEGTQLNVRVKRNGSMQFQPRSVVTADPASTAEIELKL